MNHDIFYLAASPVDGGPQVIKVGITGNLNARIRALAGNGEGEVEIVSAWRFPTEPHYARALECKMMGEFWRHRWQCPESRICVGTEYFTGNLRQFEISAKAFMKADNVPFQRAL